MKIVIVAGVLAVVIIAWITISTIIGRRRYKVTWRQGGFTVNGPPITPELRQLFGGYAVFPDAEITGIIALREGIKVSIRHGQQASDLMFYPAFVGGTVGSEVTSDIHATVAEAIFPTPERCDLCNEYVSEHTDDCPRRILEDMTDFGEPLLHSPPPNIGGEGHPDYQGPDYATERDIADEMRGIVHWHLPGRHPRYERTDEHEPNPCSDDEEAGRDRPDGAIE